MIEYTHEDHEYDCHVPSDEITKALVELDYPWKSERILRYFHEKLKYSTRQLADLFGVARQTLQGVVYEFEDFNFDPRNGRMTKMDLEQRTLGEYKNESVASKGEETTSGLSDFL